MEYKIPYVKSAIGSYNLNPYSNLVGYANNSSYDMLQTPKGDYSTIESKIKMIEV